MNIPEISLDNGKAQGKVTVCKEANEEKTEFHLTTVFCVLEFIM